MDAPEPPDPQETAQAQGGMNRDTAITQQLVNMVNQQGPTGSLTYNQSGNNTFVDSNGRTVTVPQFTATTQLTPEQQKIFNQMQGAQGNLAGLANQQSGFLKGYLNKPFSYTNRDAENWAYDLGAQRLDPRFAREEDSLRTRLTNQGIREGSAAWNNAMQNQYQAKNDAYNQLMLQGRSQGFGEALAQRNQPINEITALMSGGQVSQPQFQQTPQASVAGVDYTGLVNNQYQAQAQSHAAGMGGLFGLLSAPFAMMSDRRTKENIRRVGQTDGGVPVYVFNYIGDSVTRMGVMADEVEPDAIVPHPSGLQMVDYRKVH